MAAIDVAGYVADLKDHSVDHGFHVHDERHFVETYSLRQVWEVDLHPEEGCGGPLDLHLALDVDPRVLLSFEDAVVLLTEEEEPPDEFHFPLTFTWALPPLPSGPDLLRLAIDLAGVGGIELPLEVSAIDSFANATDGSERRLSIVARHPSRWPGCSAGRSSSATSSTVPWRSAASSSSPPTVGSAEMRRPLPGSPLADRVGCHRGGRGALPECVRAERAGAGPASLYACRSLGTRLRALHEGECLGLGGRPAPDAS